MTLDIMRWTWYKLVRTEGMTFSSYKMDFNIALSEAVAARAFRSVECK